MVIRLRESTRPPWRLQSHLPGIDRRRCSRVIGQQSAVLRERTQTGIGRRGFNGSAIDWDLPLLVGPWPARTEQNVLPRPVPTLAGRPLSFDRSLAAGDGSLKDQRHKSRCDQSVLERMKATVLWSRLRTGNPSPMSSPPAAGGDAEASPFPQSPERKGNNSARRAGRAAVGEHQGSAAVSPSRKSRVPKCAHNVCVILRSGPPSAGTTNTSGAIVFAAAVDDQTTVGRPVSAADIPTGVMRELQALILPNQLHINVALRLCLLHVRPADEGELSSAGRQRWIIQKSRNGKNGLARPGRKTASLHSRVPDCSFRVSDMTAAAASSSANPHTGTTQRKRLLPRAALAEPGAEPETAPRLESGHPYV